MIIFQLKAIGVNLLFGMFFYVVVNTICFYEQRIKNVFLINFLYFILTTISGLLYIIYLDLILFEFNPYFILFIFFGYFLAYQLKWFKLTDKLILMNFLTRKMICFIKKVFLFLINYSFWHKISTIIKNKR